MTEIITPYQKRVIQEDKMRDFFTRVCNNGALTDFFNRHGLRLTKDGRVMDNGIGALLYNSDCDINKLVEYFTILFSYTKDYSIDEKKYIEKLKTKYKKETKKLVECITSFILSLSTN